MGLSWMIVNVEGSDVNYSGILIMTAINSSRNKHLKFAQLELYGWRSENALHCCRDVIAFKPRKFQITRFSIDRVPNIYEYLRARYTLYFIHRFLGSLMSNLHLFSLLCVPLSVKWLMVATVAVSNNFRQLRKLRDYFYSPIKHWLTKTETCKHSVVHNLTFRR